MTDRLIKITTALAVMAVTGVAAIISYQHAYELVSSHGEAGVTARLLPFTVDGLIWAASMWCWTRAAPQGWPPGDRRPSVRQQNRRFCAVCRTSWAA